jgi:hypothetical protein
MIFGNSKDKFTGRDIPINVCASMLGIGKLAQLELKVGVSKTERVRCQPLS